jgi:uncharacterized membrane protein YjjB (DUF3815 family)
MHASYTRQGCLRHWQPEQLYPLWLQILCWGLTGGAVAVLFSARRKDFHIAMAAAIISYVISRAGVEGGGLEFGVLLASMSIAIFANLYGRVFKQTGALIRVPGMILLVPGTIGYHGATALFLDGGENLIDTTQMALRLLISLVVGLLFGNTLLPPRRGH